MLTRFSVKNYKCLADVSVPLTPIHVLIGQNDSGKTSLLEAMYAFCRSSEMSLVDAFASKWEGTDLVFHGASSTEIELCSDWQPESEQSVSGYGFRVGFSEISRNARCMAEWCDQNGRHVLKSTNQAYTAVGHVSQVSIGSQHEFGPFIKQINTLLSGVHSYQFDARAMAMPAVINPVRKFRMERDGFGLPTLLDDLVGYDPEKFISLRKEFCEFFPQFRSVRVESAPGIDRQYQRDNDYNAGRGNGKGIFFETCEGATIRAQQASDGAILFLGYLALCYIPKPPKLVLIEEPETGIYPKRLEEVIGLLRRRSKEDSSIALPQIVMSTHSPYVVSDFKPDEVTFLRRQSDGSARAYPLRDVPNIADRLDNGTFYLGELWYNLTEEELFQDAQPAGTH